MRCFAASNSFALVGSVSVAVVAGPLDHDLLGFNSIAKALHRALRNVLEAEFAARVLRRECTALPAGVSRSGFFFCSGRTICCEPNRAGYPIVARSLPFVQEHNTALGIVLKHVLLQVKQRA